jgi:hypothetical protein
MYKSNVAHICHAGSVLGCAGSIISSFSTCILLFQRCGVAAVKCIDAYRALIHDLSLT